MAQRNTKLTQDEFISRAKQVWGDRFDLSKAEYKSRKERVEIICREHGSFFPSANNFLAGWGCKKCGIIETAKKRTSNTEKFIAKAKNLYGDYYDYSKVNYVNSRTKVTIICPKHGEFSILPSNFLRGSGCRRCGYERNGENSRLTTKQFIERAKEVHGDMYDYSLVSYKDFTSPVKIVCTKHGVFEQRAELHLRGCGCQQCSAERPAITLGIDEFIKRAIELHGDKFDYSQCDYKGMNYPITIKCKKHGYFTTEASTHLKCNGGCPECKKERIGGLKRFTTEDFIENATIKHGNKYDYSNVNYVNAYAHVSIICPKHGEFLQRAYLHLYGNGCPHCKKSRGENAIAEYLQSNNIDFIREFSFQDCKDNHCLRFDFYLPKHNVCIEFQGIQHYKPLEIFGGEEFFEDRVKKDNIKRKYCKDHNILLLEIKYDENIETKLQLNL